MTRKPPGYWDDINNVLREWRDAVAKHGDQAKSAQWLQDNGYSGLVNAIAKHGGITAVKKSLGWEALQKPFGYLHDINNVLREWKDAVAKHGEQAKSVSWLKKNGHSSLVHAIHRKHGGAAAVRKMLGWDLLRKPDGHWDDIETVKRGWKDAVDRHGEQAKSTDWLSRNGYKSLVHAIAKHGGPAVVKGLLGWDSRKPVGYWDNIENVIREWKKVIAKHGDQAKSLEWLQNNGSSSLVNAIWRKHGGVDAFRDLMCFDITGSAAFKLRPALADIRRVVADMGDQIHAMDQKSWLLILQAQKGIQNIGDESQLTPVKLKMLRGEYQPQDYIPADGEEKSKVEQDLIDAANKTEQVQLDVPEATEIDTVDEPEEQVQRLAKLTPAQIIKATSIAASVIDDEKMVEQLVDHRIEKIWESLFRAIPKHREAMVHELKKEPTNNAYVKESVKGFLAEWSAIRHLMDRGIQGIVKPEGGDLNLMQYREAALLQRDRARMNLSDMGAGKTLSAIAGMQLAGASRVLVLCPNNTIPSFIGQLGQFLPTASTAAKTWAPFFAPEEHPQWVVNNLEMLQDRYREDIAKFLEVFKPDALVIDEIHLCKTTNADSPSQRRGILGELCNWARQNNSIIYAMTGTPVVNKLTEAVDLFRMIQPGAAEGLGIRHTINNCLAVHNAIQPFVTRYVPLPPAVKVPRKIHVNADHLLEDAMSAGKNVINIDAALAESKIDALVDLAKEDGKLLVFTTPVTGVVDPVVEALARAGIKAVRHTGEEKFEDGSWTVNKFIQDPSVKVLVASTSTLSTGVDGLQKVCGRCVFLTLPWTPAEYDQAVARLVRQGTQFRQVEITTIFAHLQDPETGESWSLDEQKHAVLTSKRTVAAAVTDGRSPTKDTLAFSLNSVTRAWSEWKTRLAT